MNNKQTGIKLVQISFSINSSTRDLQAHAIKQLIKKSHTNSEVKATEVHPETGHNRIRLHYTMTFKYESFDESIVSTLKELNEQLTDKSNKVQISFVTEFNMKNISAGDFR